MPRRRRRPDIDEAVLRELYERRMLSAREVAATLGISAPTVWRRLSAYGITTHRERLPDSSDR